MSRKGRESGLLPPHGVRALLPVLAASGGAGRSTVAGLLAQVYAPAVRTVLVDPAPRAISPWADWLGVGVARPEAAGITGLAAPGRRGGPDGLTTAGVREAATRRAVSQGKQKRGERRTGVSGEADGIGYDVLADTRPWTRPPVNLPVDPRWHARLVELGDWSAGVVDVGIPIVAAHLAARQAVRPSLLDTWMRRADAVPVLVTSAHGFGAAVLVRLLMALEQDGISAERVIVAVVNTAGTEPPRWMHTELAQLSGRLAGLVEVPYDKVIRADGLARIEDVDGSTLKAVRTIAQTAAGLVGHHHEDPDAEEPHGFEQVATAVPGVLADPGTGTAERYRGRSGPSQAEEGRPAEEARPRTGWVPQRHHGGAT